jgi:hypothetical protein
MLVPRLIICLDSFPVEYRMAIVVGAAFYQEHLVLLKFSE